MTMASMWPARLPREIAANRLRSSEVKVYHRLRSLLGDDWVVFYSRPWHGLTRYGEEKDGEADFVVAHADLGLLFLEVKGGRIKFYPHDARWTSTDRDGIEHDIKDPVAQARSAKYHILERLKSSPHWSPRWIRVRHGVIFTDSKVPERDYGPERPREIFCDHNQFAGDFAGWIAGRMSKHAVEADDGSGDDRHGHENENLGADGLRALRKLLADPIELRVPLGNTIDEDDRALQLLTTEQFQILEMTADMPRVLIRGGAGTGKTVLAMESARRHSIAGEQVLLLCFNRGLAHFMRTRLAGTSVRVSTFYDLCLETANEAGIEVPKSHNPDDRQPNAFPELLLDGLTRLPDRRFDTIIVDEGQDFPAHWWVCVTALLKDASSRLQIFFDANQKLYTLDMHLPADLGASPLRLTRNLRNTDPIHETVMRFYDGLQVLSSGVEGVPPRIVEIKPRDTASMVEAITKLITRLVEIDEVSISSIAVLTATKAEADALKSAPQIAAFSPVPCESPIEDRLVLDSVAHFKGLESQAVIIAATANFIDQPELAYVALSRPRTFLAVIGDADTLKRLKLILH